MSGILLALALTLGTPSSPAPAPADPPRVLRPCLSDEGESAFPCVWDAIHRGNLSGHSFRIYRDGRVKLISDARALELLGLA